MLLAILPKCHYNGALGEYKNELNTMAKPFIKEADLIRMTMENVRSFYNETPRHHQQHQHGKGEAVLSRAGRYVPLYHPSRGVLRKLKYIFDSLYYPLNSFHNSIYLIPL